jgi:tryptophan-rich hypothetical protein
VRQSGGIVQQGDARFSYSIPQLKAEIQAMQRKQKFPHLVGSKWTASQKIDGWRHFRVVNRKNQGQWVFAELVAACDPTVRFWINAQLLKERSLWQAGWQSLQEIESIEIP